MINPLTCIAQLRGGSDYESGTFLGTCFSYSKPSIFITAAHCVGELTEGNSIIFGAFAGPKARPIEALIKHKSSDLAILYCPNVDGELVNPFTKIEKIRVGDDFNAIGLSVDTSSFGALHWKEPITSSGPTFRYFKGHFQRFMTCHFSYLGYKYYAFELSIGAPEGLSGGPVFMPDNNSTVMGIVTENRETSTELRTIIEEHDSEGTYIEKVHSVINYAICLPLHEYKDWLDETIHELCN